MWLLLLLGAGVLAVRSKGGSGPTPVAPAGMPSMHAVPKTPGPLPVPPPASSTGSLVKLWPDALDAQQGGPIRPQPPRVFDTANPVDAYSGDPLQQQGLAIFRPPVDLTADDPIVGRPPHIVLPTFTDLGTVAQIRTADDTQQLDHAIVNDIPLAGKLLDAIGLSIDVHPDAASLSPQQERFVVGTATEQAIFNGTASAGSGTLSNVINARVARLDAVENRDGSKEVVLAQSDEDKGTAQGETGIRVGGAAGRITRSRIFDTTDSEAP